jgi:hypothetical protein
VENIFHRGWKYFPRGNSGNACPLWATVANRYLVPNIMHSKDRLPSSSSSIHLHWVCEQGNKMSFACLLCIKSTNFMSLHRSYYIIYIRTLTELLYLHFPKLHRHINHRLASFRHRFGIIYNLTHRLFTAFMITCTWQLFPMIELEVHRCDGNSPFTLIVSWNERHLKNVSISKA